MTSPKDRYLATLASGYGLMILQILLALASVPLALSYLGKEGFGIWSLATQVSIWLLLLDGGMTGALARYLIDYRKEPQGDNLQHCIATGFRVFVIQGFLVLLMAMVLGSFGDRLFDLDPKQAEEFKTVLTMLGAASCIGFSCKILQSWLFASQRLDLCNYITLTTSVVEFIVLWVLLKSGHGIQSIAWARLCQTVLTGILSWWAGIKISRFPFQMLLGAWNTAMLRTLASFGGGMFILTLGNQMLTVTQTALVTKHLGLATAAVWATAPKLLQVALQMVSKLWDYRAPYLSSLMTGDQVERLKNSFNGVFIMTAYIGGGGLGTAVALNPTFLAAWTHGAISWLHVNDGILAISFYLALLVRCIIDFVLQTKKIGLLPILMLTEGLAFVLAASWLLPLYGITGMLVASIVAGNVLRLPYAWRHLKNYLSTTRSEFLHLALHSVGGAIFGSIIYGSIIYVHGLIPSLSPWASLVSLGTLSALMVGPISIKFIMDAKKK